MPQLVWTPSALNDVQRLYNFLKAKDTELAMLAAKTIREGVQVLSANPQLGRLFDDLDADYREWPIPFGKSGYLVLYHFNGNEVAVLAVKHQKEFEYIGHSLSS